MCLPFFLTPYTFSITLLKNINAQFKMKDGHTQEDDRSFKTICSFNSCMHVANQQQPRLVVLTKGKNIIIKPETGQQTNQQASPYSSSFFPIAC